MFSVYCAKIHFVFQITTISSLKSQITIQSSKRWNSSKQALDMKIKLMVIILLPSFTEFIIHSPFIASVGAVD